MKKLILLSEIIFTACQGFSQQPNTNPNPYPKTITVTGSAEMEIVPDEIYVQIVLKEYQKRGQDKKNLDVIKNDFLGYCRAAGIPDSAISIASYSGYNNYYSLRRRKDKDIDLLSGITYQVKFSSSKQMDDLVDKLDDDAIQRFDIVLSTHSKMTEYRKQLKIQAVMAAKNKATYLTLAINENLGPAITVKEPDESTTRYVSGSNGIYSQVNVSNAVSKDYYSGKFDIDFKTIKLRYEVNVIFALQ